METTFSWLCNVATLDIIPPALVLVASEDLVARELVAFLSQNPRLKKGALVISMDGVIAVTRKNPDAPLHFGTSANWLLMLQRSFLIRDLLECGLKVLQFETDQLRLSGPMPYIRHELQAGRGFVGGVKDFRMPDIVGTTNTRIEVSGNFLYMRPTVGTRHLLSVVVDRFLMSYRSSQTSRAARRNRFHYIANDQSILTTLVTGRDWVFARSYPSVKAGKLNRDLCVDGQWFSDLEDNGGKVAKYRKYSTSELSLYPVIVNNDFVVGIDAKIQRAKRFGFWFVEKSGKNQNEVEM